MNFEQETVENSSPSRQPIFIVVLLIAVSGAAFYYFNQQLTSSITTMLNASDITFEIPPEPKIDFDFLASEEFQNLDNFPDYPNFKEGEKIEVKVGRSNPFLPYGGFVTKIEPTENLQSSEAPLTTQEVPLSN